MEEGYRRKRRVQGREERMKEQRIKEAGETRTEGKVWEIIGRERGGKKRVEEGIGEEEWKNYFMRLLGGVERKMVGERRKKIDMVKGIERWEIEKAITRLKDGKAAGEDEIVNEVWKLWRRRNKESGRGSV